MMVSLRLQAPMSGSSNYNLQIVVIKVGHMLESLDRLFVLLFNRYNSSENQTNRDNQQERLFLEVGNVRCELFEVDVRSVIS